VTVPQPAAGYYARCDGHMKILRDIPTDLTLEKLLKRMRLRENSSYIEKIARELLDIARPIARPKAVYEVCYLENKNKDSLEIGGVRFKGRLLRVNLDKIVRVFPYIVTCGIELEEIAVPDGDFICGYCLDVIKETALRSAISYLERHLKKSYALGQVSRMNPGSLASWPITQQRELFSIFGNVEELIGVKLTESYLMIPVKSVSGILFPSEVKFESCQLCPREVCPERRAPYDPNLAEKYRPATD
jgi:hypothetical protein